MKNADFYEKNPIVKKYIQLGLLEVLYEDEWNIIGKYAKGAYVAVPKVIPKNYQPLVFSLDEKMIRIVIKYGIEAIEERLKYLMELNEEERKRYVNFMTEERIPELIKISHEIAPELQAKIFNPKLDMELRKLNEARQLKENKRTNGRIR